MMTRRICHLVEHSSFNPSKVEWIVANQLIDARESQRISEFMFKRDAKASLLVQLLIRKACCDYWKVKNHEVTVSRTMRGKPFVEHVARKDMPSFNFSVSHSGNYTILVADKHDMVGCDLMKVEMTDKHFEDHRRHRRELTNAEWEYIDCQQTRMEKISAFMRFWCMKEAYLKATGEGLSINLKQLEFQLAPVHDRQDGNRCFSTQGKILSQTHVFGTTLQFSGVAKPDWLFDEVHFSVASGDNQNAVTDPDRYILAVAVRNGFESTVNAAALTPTSIELVQPSDLIQSLASYSSASTEEDPTFEQLERIWKQFEAKAEAPSRRRPS